MMLQFFWEGGDFMLERLDGRREPTHPLVSGRTPEAGATVKLPTVVLAARTAPSNPSTLELATTIDRELQKAIETMDSEGGVMNGRQLRPALEIATTIDHVVLASVGSMDGRE